MANTHPNRVEKARYFRSVELSVIEKNDFNLKICQNSRFSFENSEEGEELLF
jgi:hypothetical protein